MNTGMYREGSPSIEIGRDETNECASQPDTQLLTEMQAPHHSESDSPLTPEVVFSIEDKSTVKTSDFTSDNSLD